VPQIFRYDKERAALSRPRICISSKRAFRRDVANDRDSESGDCPNDDRSYDYGEPEHHRCAESKSQPEASANASRVSRGGERRRHLGQRVNVLG
jgi:hypothetical protein